MSGNWLPSLGYRSGSLAAAAVRAAGTPRSISRTVGLTIASSAARPLPTQLTRAQRFMRRCPIRPDHPQPEPARVGLRSVGQALVARRADLVLRRRSRARREWRAPTRAGGAAAGRRAARPPGSCVGHHSFEMRICRSSLTSTSSRSRTWSTGSGTSTRGAARRRRGVAGGSAWVRRGSARAGAPAQSLAGLVCRWPLAARRTGPGSRTPCRPARRWPCGWRGDAPRVSSLRRTGASSVASVAAIRCRWHLSKERPATGSQVEA